MNASRPHILQFICSTGFYGAERWILALCNNTNSDDARYSLAVTLEPGTDDLELVKQFEASCGDVFQAPMRHRFDFAVVNTLAQYIKDNHIDVIHTHGYKSDILGVLTARKAKIPVVVTPHGFENAADIKLKFFIWAGCQAMRFADKVVPLSPQLMEDVKAFKVKANKLEYIQNGVDLSEVDAVRNAKAKLTKNKKRIGFIGQMISRKNIRDIIDIFNDIAQERRDVELVLLGDGDERDALESYASSSPVIEDIKFLGYRDDRLDYLKSFDLFVMTSTLEGIPRCLMEACAMRIPVAAYNIAGVDQLITHNETGVLAEPGDTETLKALWLKLLDEPELAAELGQKAGEYVNRHYSAKRMANEYLTLFKRLLENTNTLSENAH